jgi:hypothetical protein
MTTLEEPAYIQPTLRNMYVAPPAKAVVPVKTIKVPYPVP